MKAHTCYLKVNAQTIASLQDQWDTFLGSKGVFGVYYGGFLGGS